MKSSLKAWAGVILLFLVAAGSFWHASRQTSETEDQRGGPQYDGHLPLRAGFAPQYVKDFYQALEDGNTKAVEQALAQHRDLLRRRFGNETALHVAARCNHGDLIDLLLQHHADPSTRGQWNGTALHWACWFGSKAAAERLIAHGFDIEDKHDTFGSSPLLWAAHGSGSINNPRGDYAGTVMLLLAKGAAADTQNADGVPAVLMASPKIAEILLANGAKPPATRPSAPSAPSAPFRALVT